MEVLIPAIRQYKHNDGSEGFVMGYDKSVTNEIVKNLVDEVERLKKMIGNGLGWEDLENDINHFK